MEGDFACLWRSAGPLPGHRACIVLVSEFVSPFLLTTWPALTYMKVSLTGATGAGQSLPIRHSGLGNSRDNGVSHVTYLGRRPLAPRVVLPGDNPTNNASPIVRIPSFPPSSTRTSWPIRLCSRKRLPSTTRAYGLWVPRP